MSFVFKPIEPSHVSITPFYANKLWVINSTTLPDLYASASTYVDSDISMSVFYGTYQTGTFYSASDSRTTNGQYSRLVWNSIYHTYYRNYQLDPWNYKQGEPGVETRNISKNITVLSIPQPVIGAGIDRGSFEMLSASIYLMDDMHGNIIGGKSTTLSQSIYNDSLRNFYYCSYKFYEGYKFVTTTSSTARSTFDVYNHGNIGGQCAYNLTASNGVVAPVIGPNMIKGTANKVVVLPGGPDSPYYLDFKPYTGTASAYIRIPHADSLNFDTNENFTLSTWLFVSGTIVSGTKTGSLGNSSGSNVIISKNGLRRIISNTDILNGQYLPGNILVDQRVKAQYPYQLELIDIKEGYGAAGKLRFSRSDGVRFTSITSSATIPVNSWSMVSCIKSGAAVSIWINGSQDSIISESCLATTANDCDIFIGCRGDLITTGIISSASTDFPIDASSQYYGKMGAVHFFDRALTSTDISGLYSAWPSSWNPNKWGNYDNHYGNILYNQGLVILTNGRTYTSNSVFYNDIGNTSSLYFDYVKFRSTKLITMNEVICVSGQNEQNMTTNPTVLINKNGICNPGIGASEDGIYNDNGECYNFVTGSSFSPYITTVGLYNDAGELLVVGKLATPIRKPTNCDVIFAVRYDT